MTTYKALFALLSRLAARRLMLMEGEKSVWERKHPEPTMISSFHDEEEGKEEKDEDDLKDEEEEFEDDD